MVSVGYPRDQITKLHARLVCHAGFALVVQEVRGSTKCLECNQVLFQHDGWAGYQDGRQTVQWITKQKWCDGRVVTWGPSALGMTQSLLAPDAPDALKAQYVIMSPSDMYSQTVYQGGAFRQELVKGWVEMLKYPETNLDAVLAHPEYDSFWKYRNFEIQAERVNVPGVFLGGWDDAFLQGTINSFTSIQNEGGPDARGKCRLVIGPWSHWNITWVSDTRNAKKYMPSAAEPIQFFLKYVNDFRASRCDTKPVNYFVMGDRSDRSAPGNFWRAADNWPPPSEPRPLYFHADGDLLPEPPAAMAEQLNYSYDPNDPVPTIGGRNLMIAAGSKDQRAVESRPDVLVFSTPPLDAPVEVTGRLLAELFVSSDSPDTDFTVKLTDVYPDGRSMLIADGIFRARYHESFEEARLLEPGKVYPLTVDLWSTSTIFNRGHRIRVSVSSSNAPRFQANPNTGGRFGSEGPVRTAVNTLHLSKEHASRIVLPIYRGGE